MATTIPDVILTNSAYTDVYVASGLAIGTSVIIQNKSTVGAFLQLKSSQPLAASADGVFLEAYSFYVVDQGEVGCWARGNTKLSVQEVV